MKRALMFAGAVAVVLTACSGEERSPLETSMYNKDNDKIGTAVLTEQPEGVQVKLKVEGLEPGMHGIAVHEFPKCEAPEFKTAGNHFNPTSKEHGLMNPKGAHVGDMPNVEADPSGMIDVEVMLPQAKLKENQKSLLRQEGTSLIIQSGPDDGMTQPAGDAGERVACGVITLDADKDETSDPTELDKQQE
ncbi:superoxide dismutase family protein [Halobacillus litoralis]|uniref:Superoxide dismutase [Cu-Zn] n=1 Tax=Halobacillus litoralis TaxID=45668 RepID=A0A845DXW3_9BACI|nr:superoxide dismutase family protein [Halobacillus litoralis]MYL21142.1 superoxide dismutase family protein [Halobacillus litoralis]